MVLDVLEAEDCCPQVSFLPSTYLDGSELLTPFLYEYLGQFSLDIFNIVRMKASLASLGHCLGPCATLPHGVGCLRSCCTCSIALAKFIVLVKLTALVKINALHHKIRQHSRKLCHFFYNFSRRFVQVPSSAGERQWHPLVLSLLVTYHGLPRSSWQY